MLSRSAYALFPVIAEIPQKKFVSTLCEKFK